MQKTVGPPRSNDEECYVRDGQTSFKCGGCGEEFEKPILATVSSNVSAQRYYACPRCLTKVSQVEDKKGEEEKEMPVLTKHERKVVVKLEEAVKCNHFLGYLKKRPKNTPIPEECLTCDKMIECLMH